MASCERLLRRVAVVCAGVFLVLFAVERSSQLLSSRTARRPAEVAAARVGHAPQVVAAIASIVGAESTVATVKFDLMVVGL